MSRNTQRSTAAKAWVKVASRPQFNLYRSTTDMNLFQVRLNASGSYLRRRFHAPSVERALVEAPRVAGLEKVEETRDGIDLATAFTMALANTRRREESRRAWLKDTERFFRWLKKHHPLCTNWAAMTRQILREYLGTFAGKSDNHRRLSMQPLLQTAGFMHREYCFANIGERMGIGSRLKTQPKTVYLEDVVSLCDFLRDQHPHLEVGAALQGLAGLQLLEALRLTWDKVDLSRGLIEISGETKNDYRNRVIPVSARVLEALRRADVVRRARKGTDVQPVAENVVVGARGSGYDDKSSYSRQMTVAFLRWNPQCDWAPKDLRNCLPTFAKLEGIHGTIWEQYIGHAPRTVTDRHYVPRLTARTPGERHSLDRAMELFRRFVVAPVEAYRPEAEICNFLQLGPNAAPKEGSEGSVSSVN